MIDTSWVQHAIWWHVYPLGFTGADATGADATGADRSPAPRLDHLVAWLDDTVDHWHVDERPGGDAAFVRLINAAHARGLRVMLDGVFNHVGPDFAGLDGPRAGWVRRDRDGRALTFEGHPGLLALDHGNPEVADYVTDVMDHWLDAGADAWRLDAAYAVPPDFWPGVLERVRSAHPDVFVLGEMLHGDYADYVRRSCRTPSSATTTSPGSPPPSPTPGTTAMRPCCC